MRSFIAATAATLAFLSLASISDAQAGSSQSAPSKYSPNRGVISPVVWTRPVAIREFSSSSARRRAPGR